MFRRCLAGGSRGAPGTNDGGAGVFVDAMGLVDLEFVGSGGFERAAEVRLGEGAGDAASPGGDVGAGGVV